MADPPVEGNICPCCGTEFGYDDFNTPFEELRRRWVERNAPWFSRHTPPPPGWDGIIQLSRAGLLLTIRTPADYAHNDYWPNRPMVVSYA